MINRFSAYRSRLANRPSHSEQATRRDKPTELFRNVVEEYTAAGPLSIRFQRKPRDINRSLSKLFLFLERAIRNNNLCLKRGCNV